MTLSVLTGALPKLREAAAGSWGVVDLVEPVA
jgi:hypothetical protein